MLLTTQPICVSTGTASKGNLVRPGPFQRAHWSPGPPGNFGDTRGFNHAATTPSASFAQDFPVACAKGMDRRKARMTDAPGNAGQHATIRCTQGLRAASEVRILGRWKYFDRYSETGRVPAVRTQSAFGLRSIWGNQDHADPAVSRMFVKLGGALGTSTLVEHARTAHHPSFYASDGRTAWRCHRPR